MSYEQRRADFSESTYAMYLTVEIQRWLHDQGDLDGVALLPSLRGEADIGYDVAIPRRWAMLYLQFKMPRYLRRSSAREHAVFRGPYFRFGVKTDATLNGREQHNVLCELEASGEAVFYASPCFLTSEELKRHALNDGMYLNSVFPRPLQLGPVPRDSKHCYAYTNSSDIRAFSDPGPPNEASFESAWQVVSASIGSARPMGQQAFLARALERLHEYVDVQSDEVDALSELPVSQKVGLYASTIGLLPILIGERLFDA